MIDIIDRLNAVIDWHAASCSAPPPDALAGDAIYRDAISEITRLRELLSRYSGVTADGVTVYIGDTVYDIMDDSGDVGVFPVEFNPYLNTCGCVGDRGLKSCCSTPEIAATHAEMLRRERSEG